VKLLFSSCGGGENEISCQETVRAGRSAGRWRGREALLAALAAGRTLVVDRYALSTRSGNPAQAGQPCAGAGREALLAALAAGRTLVVDRYALSGAAFTAAKRLPGLDLAWCQARAAGGCLPSPCSSGACPAQPLPCLIMHCRHGCWARVCGEFQVAGGGPGGPRSVLFSLRVRRAQVLCIVVTASASAMAGWCACGCGRSPGGLWCWRVACAWARRVPSRLPSMQLPLGVKRIKHTTDFSMSW